MKRVVSTLPLLFVVSCFVHAQPVDLYSLSLQELLQVEVTGSTLTSENLQTVPAAVSVFTHEEIRKLGLDTLDELMNLVPGFQTYRSSSGPLQYPYSARGRRIGLTSAEILVLVDGQRVSDSRSGGSGFVVPKFPVMHIERVEFIRGPGGAVYGSNAMMGVINIITRSGASEFSASYGSFNRRKAYGLFSTQTGNVEWDMFGHIDSDVGDNFRVQDTFSTNRIKTDDPRELLDINVKMHWYDTRINLQYHQLRSENFYAGDLISNGFNRYTAELGAISLKQTFNWRSFESYLWVSYSYSELGFDVQSTALGELAAISSPASNDALFSKTDFDDVNETRVQWHNHWKINAQSSLQVGLEQRHIDVKQTLAKNNFDLADLSNNSIPIRYYGSFQATTPINEASKRDVVGIYSQYQQRLAESTHLTLGGRYDDFSRIGSQFSPRLGIVQELNYQHSVKLLYGEAFRAPTEEELYLQNNPVIVGNPNLNPERVESWELIWVTLLPDTAITFGYFQNHYRDSIVLANVGNGALQYNNVNQDPIKGAEFELSYELTELCLLRATYTHISEKPELSFREADQLISFMANYQRGHWNANLSATYRSEREMSTGGSDSIRIKLDSYWLLSGKLSYQFTTQLRGIVQVKNLLNEDYLNPAMGGNLTEGIPDRGREMLAGFLWQF